MSSKHLTTGSTLPPTKDGILRIYSMRFCPYAHRAVLVANAKKIPHDVVNVNLKQKPEWFLERNPPGKVPCIETPKGILYESLIVADYLDEAYPTQDSKLNSQDPYERALDRIWIENYSNIISKFFKIILNKNDLEIVKVTMNEVLENLDQFSQELKRRGTLFFGRAAKPGMLDYMIWPCFERIPTLKLFFPSLFDYESLKSQHPELENWRQAMKQDPAVKVNFLTAEMHFKYLQTYIAGAPNYDIMEKE